WLENFQKIRVGKEKSSYTKDVIRTLEWYVYPTIGDMLIEEVDRSVILTKTVIKEIWFTKKVSGWRLQQVLRQIFDWATSHGQYTRSRNPAEYDDALKMILPEGVHTVEKHDNIPSDELHALMEKLRGFRYGATFAKKMGLPREQRPAI